MAHKRPRPTLEDATSIGPTRDAPFARYGTPLPAADGHARDDGSYVPIWKQEVVDERGRKRLHGAFTGGFSAGYFNTVGSKEGWIPSNFVSSRTQRHETAKAESRPEDYMDEEDLAEQAETQQLQTNDAFAGFGTTEADVKRSRGFMDLFKSSGETMGVKLLRKMGWKEGQAVGARSNRRAPHDDGRHIFTPEITQMAAFTKKHDQKGLGYSGEAKLESHSSAKNASDDDGESRTRSVPGKAAVASKARGGGFGTGVLNDTGSDDDDPYEMGPKISYNKVIGGNKKKAAPANPVAKPRVSNPLLTSRPVFTSRKLGPGASTGFRKCHDGRLPLEGFLLSMTLDSLTFELDRKAYPPIEVPLGWAPTKSELPIDHEKYKSTAEAARSAKMDSATRVAILGEAQLPSKSVFDFLSPAARDRIAKVTGRGDLPAGLGEVTSDHDASEAETNAIPELDEETAVAALGRGVGGWMPYAEDPAKRERYRALLAFHGKLSDAPQPPTEMTREIWLRELEEFAHAARVFKPVTGAMASRFRSSQASVGPQTSAQITDKPQLTTPSSEKIKDPAEEAARMKMYGPMTRKELTFYPTRLLCKRFNIKVPAHVNSENEGQPAHGQEDEIKQAEHDDDEDNTMAAATASFRVREFASGGWHRPALGAEEQVNVGDTAGTVNPDRNDALETQRAGDELFAAVFGDEA